MGFGSAFGAVYGGGIVAPIICTDPIVASVVALDSTGTRWRVTFDRLVWSNPVVAFAGAYALSNGAGHQPDVLAADPEEGARSQYVDLTTEELINGDTYTLTIVQLEEAAISGCNDPSVFGVTAIDSTTVRVTFGTAVDVNAVLLFAGAYALTSSAGHSPVVRQVLTLATPTTTQIDLKTSEHRDGIAYDLTIHRLEAA